jgi:hypothetical protein
MKKFRTEDWIVTFLSIPLIILIGFAGLLPNGGPKIPESLTTLNAWFNIGIFFLIAFTLLFIGNKLLGRPIKGVLVSFSVIFVLALLAQWVAKLEIVKFYGFEAVFFSVIFGLIIRNTFRVPDWLKPAIQGEFFIKIGVICLGATVLFSDILKSGAAGLIQATFVICVVWFFAYTLARKLKVERSTAMTLASGLSICGVSACITAAGVAGIDPQAFRFPLSPFLSGSCLPGHIFLGLFGQLRVIGLQGLHIEFRVAVGAFHFLGEGVKFDGTVAAGTFILL